MAVIDQLTFVVTCKGRLAHLQESLPALAGQDARTVVVDSSCPDGTADWVSSNVEGVDVVRHVDDGCFNRAIAKNRGAAAASTPWLCFVDADAVLAPDFVAAIAPLLQQPQVLRFHRQATGWLVVPSIDFRAVGGFDEVFEDWGDEDDDLCFRLEKRGLPTTFLPAELVARELPHSTDDRMRYHAEKNLHVALFRNSLYRYLKNLLINNSQEPTLEQRRVMFGRVKQAIADGIAGGSDRAAVTIPIPNQFWMKDTVEMSIALTLNLQQFVSRPGPIG